jgi:GntR family transcriptional repressor for pyruvate dehydrogenase complex
MVKGLDPMSRSTLSEQVAKRLAARIAAGDWKPGEKLPSEAELCKALSIGRSSLREALTSLAFIGLIRVRAGGGSYVAEQPSVYSSLHWLHSGMLHDEKTFGEFVEARLILATELAGLCADRITSEELSELELLVERMKNTVHDSKEFSKLNLAFHLSMGKAAKNAVLNNILLGAQEQTRELIAKSLLLDEGKENALRGLVKILETFKQGNPVKAREVMRSHLQLFQRGYKVLFETSSLKKLKKSGSPAGKELRKTLQKDQGTLEKKKPASRSAKTPGASKVGTVLDKRRRPQDDTVAAPC